jgi:hypothetical protein
MSTSSTGVLVDDGELLPYRNVAPSGEWDAFSRKRGTVPSECEADEGCFDLHHPHPVGSANPTCRFASFPRLRAAASSTQAGLAQRSKNI